MTEAEASGDRIQRSDAEAWAFAALLLYFAARGLYLAFRLAPGMPPDELTHVGLCALYAGSAWLPGVIRLDSVRWSFSSNSSSWDGCGGAPAKINVNV